jgi:hypothetical protein
MESNKETKVDSIVESVINKIKTRSEIGIAKYGITLDRTDYSTIDWIDAAIEEQMDNILYLTRLKKDIIQLEEELSTLKQQKAGTKVVYTVVPKSNETYTDEEPVIRKRYGFHR